MSFVLNEWSELSDDPMTTKLHISGVYTVDALVHTSDVWFLKKHSWCYEQAKGNVYTMDTTMELPAILGVVSPRVYLWKYIVFMHTNKIAKAWKRAALLDYRFNHGAVQYIDSISVAAIAGGQVST